jgi:hypothetical protein
MDWRYVQRKARGRMNEHVQAIAASYAAGQESSASRWKCTPCRWQCIAVKATEGAPHRGRRAFHGWDGVLAPWSPL